LEAINIRRVPTSHSYDNFARLKLKAVITASPATVRRVAAEFYRVDVGTGMHRNRRYIGPAIFKGAPAVPAGWADALTPGRARTDQA
jgi:hypothetical protein